MEDLRVLFFFYIPQSFLMILAGTWFYGLNLSREQITLLTLLYGFSIYFVRNIYAAFEIPYGTHTLILSMAFCTLFATITKQNLIYCLGITCFSFSLVLLGGGLVGVGVGLFGLTIDDVLSKYRLQIVFGHLENTLLFLYIILDKTIGISLNAMVKETNE